MKRAPYFCPICLCPHDGRCPARQPAAIEPRSSTAQGYDRVWRKVRLLALERDKYLCQLCLMQGTITALTPSSPVDHVIPIRDGGARLQLSNLQSLCVECHNRKTRTEQNRQARPAKPKQFE